MLFCGFFYIQPNKMKVISLTHQSIRWKYPLLKSVLVWYLKCGVNLFRFLNIFLNVERLCGYQSWICWCCCGVLVCRNICTTVGGCVCVCVEIWLQSVDYNFWWFQLWGMFEDSFKTPTQFRYLNVLEMDEPTNG